MQSMAQISLDSITYAMRAREILSQHGITSNIVRLDPQKTPKGCAFGLQMPRRSLEAAAVILKKADIGFSLLYD